MAANEPNNKLSHRDVFQTWYALMTLAIHLTPHWNSCKLCEPSWNVQLLLISQNENLHCWVTLPTFNRLCDFPIQKWKCFSQVRLSLLLGWILPYNSILRRTWHCLLMLWEVVKSIGTWVANLGETNGNIPYKFWIWRFLGAGGPQKWWKFGNLTIKSCCLSIVHQQMQDTHLSNKYGDLSL